MRDDTKAVMLFAAGFGTRMQPLTLDRPKPMIEVAGKPLIGHALDLARGIEPTCVVANLHYKPQMLIDYLWPRGVEIVVEEPEILDTGGGLRNALPLLGKAPVVTLNTDAIWSGPNPLELLENAWDPDRMEGLLMCVPVSRTVAYEGAGDFRINPSGRLTRGPGGVYAGAQIIKTHRLHDIAGDRFSLNLLWDLMLAEGTLHGLAYPGKWCDVGHPSGIALAEAMIGESLV
jgi:MurNAc alpha-1-phosphate uridylyltransferase